MLSLLTITAHGQAIYKCAQKDGTTAFQDSPCPGAPNAPPMSLSNPDAAAPPARSYGSTPTAGTATGRLSPQQARALIDQFMHAHQVDSAMAVARRYGQMDYFSQRNVQGSQSPTLPSQPPGALQPQGDLSPQQRAQLKQELDALQTSLQTLSAKNAAPAPPGLPSDAHQLPWTLVFMTNADGSVSPRGPVRYNGVSFSGPTEKFTHQALFAGVDLTSMQGRGLWAHFEGRVLVIDKFQ
ncbi:DUF4124 domain-containing protein [Dyella lipolytica]|nr:DUF4124 domain-containing protein [Dyella lipolytica]